MKKIKLNLVAVAVVLGVCGAFATKASNHKTGGTGTGDYWFDPSGSTYSGYQNSMEDEQSLTGCSGENTACQSGYRDNQLNSPGNPSSGVKATQKNSPDEVIFTLE